MSGERFHGNFRRDLSEEWRGHWRAGLASFIGTGLGGSIAPTIFSVFILPLEQTFGWTRSEVMLAFSFTSICGLSAPFFGRLIDRVGPRKPLLGAFAGVAALWVLLAANPGELLWFYAALALLSVVGMPTTGLGYSRVLCSHFVKTRGTALAVGRAGTSLATALLPMALYFAIEHGTWRAGYMLMAALILFVALPVTWWGIDRGFAPTLAAANPRPDGHHTSTLDLLTNRYVILMCLGGALAYFAIIGISSQAIPILVDRRLSEEQATWLVGLLGFSSLAGTFVTGFLLDRYWAPSVALAVLALGATGALILATFPGELNLLTLGMVLVGIVLGAEIDIGSYLVTRYCGMANYSRIYGSLIVAIAGASAFGPWLSSTLYESTGNYAASLLASATSLGLAAVVYLMMGHYPDILPE